MWHWSKAPQISVDRGRLRTFAERTRSFYLPFPRVNTWAWETYWLVGGFFSWIIIPWIMALAVTSDLPRVLRETPGPTLFWTYLFGLLWGLGGLTFGLTMRYLGMSLGMAMVLGHVSGAKAGIGDQQYEEAETEIVSSKYLR